MVGELLERALFRIVCSTPGMVLIVVGLIRRAM